MPVTASGTTWNYTTATLPGLGRVRYSIADDAAADRNIPALVLAHGANGSRASFSQGAGFGASGFRDMVIDRRMCVIEGDGGPPTGYESDGSPIYNHWGNAINRESVSAGIEWAAGLLDIGKLIPTGLSMGGVVSKWLFTRSPYARDCAGLISFAGVGTLFVGNLDPVPTDVPTNIAQRSGRYFGDSILTAYGAGSYAELEYLAADHAPENWSPTVWDGKRILELFAQNDIAVPWSPRGSGPLRALREGFPAVDIAEDHGVLTSGPKGRGHDLAEGYGVHLAAVEQFLTDALPSRPRIVGNLYVNRGGALYPLTFGT